MCKSHSHGRISTFLLIFPIQMQQFNDEMKNTTKWSDICTNFMSFDCDTRASKSWQFTRTEQKKMSPNESKNRKHCSKACWILSSHSFDAICSILPALLFPTFFISPIFFFLSFRDVAFVLRKIYFHKTFHRIHGIATRARKIMGRIKITTGDERWMRIHAPCPPPRGTYSAILGAHFFSTFFLLLFSVGNGKWGQLSIHWRACINKYPPHVSIIVYEKKKKRIMINMYESSSSE